MNLDLSSLPMPIRLGRQTPMSDEELMRFSDTNKPFRMEREPNGEILIMTPAGTNEAFIQLRIARALGDWADEDGRGLVCESNAGFTLPDGSVRSSVQGTECVAGFELVMERVWGRRED